MQCSAPVLGFRDFARVPRLQHTSSAKWFEAETRMCQGTGFHVAHGTAYCADRSLAVELRKAEADQCRSSVAACMRRRSWRSAMASRYRPSRFSRMVPGRLRRICSSRYFAARDHAASQGHTAGSCLARPRRRSRGRLEKMKARLDALLRIHADLLPTKTRPSIGPRQSVRTIAPGEQAEGEYAALVGCAGRRQSAQPRVSLPGTFVGKHVAFDQPSRTACSANWSMMRRAG